MRIKDSEGKLYGHVNVGPEPLLPGGDIKGRTKVKEIYMVFVVPGTANELVSSSSHGNQFGDAALYDRWTEEAELSRFAEGFT